MIGLRKRLLPWNGRNDTADVALRQETRATSRIAEERFRAQSDHLDARFYQSIRFKLTAWYASILILVLVASGLALQMLLARALDGDVEERLLAAKNEIVSQTRLLPAQVGVRRGEQTREELKAFTPDLDSFLLSGLWVSVYDPENDRFVDTAGALSEVPPELNAAIRSEHLLDITSFRFGTVEVGSSKTRVLSHPIVDPSAVDDLTAVKIILIGESLGSQGRIMSLIDQVLQIAGAIGIALAAWGGWLLAGRVLSPVERLTRTADAIGSSDGRVSLSRRLDVPPTGDELSRLAMTFNAMLDRIEAAFMVQRRFVSDASHELRTPLTSVRGNVDVLQRQLKSGRAIAPGDMAEALGDVQRESARMGRLIDDLLVLARNDAAGLGYLLKPEPVSLDVIANEAYKTASALVNGQHLSLQKRDEVMVHGDGDRLVQVMLILIDNALRHTPAGGSVELRVGRATDERENLPCALIEVEDSGQGISIDHVPHLFQRFYRIESARSRPSGGTGLGLAIALAIVRGHHGWIDVETAQGHGTTFSVWLPLIEYISGDPDTDPVLLGNADPHPANEASSNLR
ncbi:MAG: ATP-binding protein [Chloroflexota bacterium]|nr:ATP-binding protein [Chloroflexota bacterium]